MPVRDPLRLAGRAGAVKHVSWIFSRRPVRDIQFVTWDVIFQRAIIVTNNLLDLIKDNAVGGAKLPVNDQQASATVIKNVCQVFFSEGCGNRNSHCAGQETPQKSDRKCEAVRQNDQDTLSRSYPLLTQKMREASTGSAEFTEGESLVFTKIDDFVRMKRKVASQQFMRRI
jgi:hypothetical protein